MKIENKRNRCFCFFYGFFALFLFSLLAACGQEQTSVMLYTSVPDNVIEAFEIEFEEEYPQIDLQVYRAGTSDVLARIQEEIEAGQILADVLWVADFTVGEELKEAGVLLQYTPPEAESLLPAFQDDEGYYFAARLLNMVVVYNTDLVSSPPTGYDSLFDPQYKGMVGHASPSSGAFLYFMGALLQNPAYGEAYFEKLAENEPMIETNTEISESIVNGELAIGISIDFIVRQILQDNPAAPIDFIYPETGVVLVPSPIAIFKDTTNLEGAKIFESFVLSVAGQSLLRDLAGVVSVRLDVLPPEGLDSITRLSIMPADPEWIYLHRDQILISFEVIYNE